MTIQVCNMERYLKPMPIDSWRSVSSAALAQPSSTPPVWVQLAALPNPYSHDQGLVLCRHSDDEWLVWVPEHGETILHRSEFFVDADWN
jgi:hypothetical protein